MARNAGQQERQIQTVNGLLTLKRSVLEVKVVVTDGKQTRFTIGYEPVKPLDEHLKISELPFKMSRRMMTETAFWGQNQSSYRMAEYIMKERLGYGVTDEYIRQVTDHVGREIYEKDREAAGKTDEHLLNMEYSHDLPGVLYLMVDGAAINTRKEDEQGSTWRENKLGLVFNSNDVRVRGDTITADIVHKEYVTCLGGVEEFKQHLFECALRNGYGRYEKTVIISDGATWIRNMGEELFPDAVQILDFYHLAENICRFGKCVYGEEPGKYSAWAEGLIELARKSEREELLGRLAEYQGRKLPPGVVNPYTYIWNNREKIDYAGYRRLGYYIGSGPIESGNKTVLQKRCKQAGMRWNEQNARHLLALRAKVESKLWPRSAV